MDKKPSFTSKETEDLHREMSSRMSENDVLYASEKLIAELDELRYGESKEVQRRYDSFVVHIQKMLESDTFSKRHIEKYKRFGRLV